MVAKVYDVYILKDLKAGWGLESKNQSIPTQPLYQLSIVHTQHFLS